MPDIVGLVDVGEGVADGDGALGDPTYRQAKIGLRADHAAGRRVCHERLMLGAKWAVGRIRDSETHPST